ncbi:MAG: DUF434 domain-containing protein [Desulfatiglandales bacterium]
MDIDGLREAICDLRYLLNRGYRRKAALNVVSNRYGLSTESRNFLVRAVFSSAEAEENKKKLLELGGIKGKEVAIDGYNVMICVEESLRGGDVFLCDDGFVRDARGAFGNYKASSVTDKAIDKILRLLSKNSVGKAVFVFDSQISHSGELASKLRLKMRGLGIEGDVVAVPNADHIVGTHQVVGTSDRAIIKRASKALDIVSYIAKDIKRLPECP